VPNFDDGLHDDDRNSSTAQIADLVGEAKRVLGIGSGQDAVWRELREAACTVVESDPATTPLTALADEDPFDVVVYADVVGRVEEPTELLRSAASFLAPGGRVVVSAPNVTHGSLRLALLQGRWQPAPKGFLDPAQVNLFGRESLLELIESAGLQCEDMRAVVRDPLDMDLPIDEDALPDGIVEWVRNQPDSLLSEFQLAAVPVTAGTEAVHVRRVIPAANPDDVRRQDRHTDAAVDAWRAELAMRDHVIGLQAEATAAQILAEYEGTRIKNLTTRLEKQTDDIDVLKRRIVRLERQGFVGLLRRAKRKLVP
jgi:hypothetical protein